MSEGIDPIRSEGDRFAPGPEASRWRALLHPRVLIVFFSSLAVFSMAVVDVGRSSPGPLSEVHQRESQLAGRFGCNDCHGGWRQSMAQACLECHGNVEHQLGAMTGFHGTLPKALANECGRCHSDHHGADFGLIQEQSFVLAGFESSAAFDHDAVGFEMRGTHLELACTECHPNAEVGVLAQGEQRFGGLSSNCATCHEDTHEPTLGTRCDKCHVQEDFTSLEFPDHDRYLALVGGHGNLDCRTCHGESDEHSLEAHVGQKLPGRNCKSCHSSPHAERFELSLAAQMTTARGQICIACHREEHTDFGSSLDFVTARQHSASGFDLAEPHADQDCAVCHDPALSHYDERYPGRSAESCAQCHADPHGGQFEEVYALNGEPGATDCRRCHSATHFEPHGFDQVAHAQTRLELKGAHAEAECATCHSDVQLEASGEVRQFMGTELTCEGCHSDPHRGLLERDAVHDAMDFGVQGHCAACHESVSFKATDRELFDHGDFAGFELLGAHAQADCQSCHPESTEADELGRRFGFAGGSFERVGGCADCHSDPHGGVFDQGQHVEDTGEITGCARCHTESSFRLLRDPFDHGAWTGFVLEGLHAEASCTDCHAPIDPEAHGGRSMAEAQGGTCQDCHATPHRTQFLGSPIELAQLGGHTFESRDCASCHSDSEAWHAQGFDHDALARFALGESHAEVGCAACHAIEIDEVGTFTRYRPMASDCRDCHGFESGDLRGRDR